MKKIFFLVISGLVFTHAAIAEKSIYYCARTDQISISTQPVSYAPYLYTSPQTLLNDGVQPALMGSGLASQMLAMKSAVWTDNLLACNYYGLTAQSANEVMVLVSQPLGDEIRCVFPGNKSFCNSSRPEDCPLNCET